jgi:hypothetical protein
MPPLPNPPSLTRRRSDNSHQETWLVYCDGVQVGSIGERAGVPVTADPWQWSCGFYPGLAPGQRRGGIAPTFAEARDGFERDWADLLPEIPEGAFDANRYSVAFTAWKYRMFDTGCRMPTQTKSDVSKCFCGVEITSSSSEAHIRDHHMDPA